MRETLLWAVLMAKLVVGRLLDGVDMKKMKFERDEILGWNVHGRFGFGLGDVSKELFSAC